MVRSPWLAYNKQAILAAELDAIVQAFCDELQWENKVGRHVVVPCAVLLTQMNNDQVDTMFVAPCKL